MRSYELVFILQPELDDTAVEGLVEKVKGWITEAGGTVSKIDRWGKRRLAYPINKRREGQYILFDMNMPPAFSIELERNLRFQEQVMRFLIVNRD
ncbi:MAG TPA: 30S ribosomal protein S6 [Anaerolineaceae bacterium]|nr:30S ribosomal protein S6 [Anaerolineaceae bacterium]